MLENVLLFHILSANVFFPALIETGWALNVFIVFLIVGIFASLSHIISRLFNEAYIT